MADAGMTRAAWFLRWCAIIFISIPILGVSTVLGVFARVHALRALRAWSRLTTRLLGIELAVEHRNSFGHGPQIFVQLNQAHLLETVLWPQILPPTTYGVMNLEFALLPLFGWAYASSYRIVVVRQWHAQAVRALSHAEMVLRGGGLVGISIEGRRTGDGRLGEYKKGPVVLALATGATIVPVILREVGFRRRIKVILGEAIPTDGLSYEDRDALTAKLRAVAIQELGL